MGRIVPPFRQLYQETVSDLETELRAALVDLGHKSAFDLLLKEAWNPEQAAMGNSTLPTVCDKLNIMSAIHLRKLIATLVRELNQRDSVIDKLEERIGLVEQVLREQGCNIGTSPGNSDLKIDPQAFNKNKISQVSRIAVSVVGWPTSLGLFISISILQLPSG